MTAELSLVIPFYNEEENCERTVRDLERELSLFNYELLLVDNGSRDSTNQILSSLCAQSPNNLRLIVVAKNEGYGNGILAGLAQAGGKYVGYAWGDNQVPASDVARVFRELKAQRTDLAKITRVKRQDGVVRKIQSAGYNFLFSFLFGVHSHDVNGCPKIMRREVLEAVRPKAKDWWIDAEIMIGATRRGFKIIEVPVEFRSRKGGKSNVGWKTVFEFAINMLKAKVGV